ncbi:hypothetical protein IQ07DRAFT_682528 [Pyrenochaeta sp. DS3sAY3a]|nr:hypothetical protein IQ07DRAFT_682528 [Pyrenochaeta sp. DS3sAY3a]
MKSLSVANLPKKTLTGCWTCRHRRVKCDEGRPHCRRCVHSGITCQGYYIRLTWTNPQVTPRGTSQRARRRRIAHQHIEGADDLQDSLTLKAYLRNIDYLSDPGNCKVQGGLFTTFMSTPLSDVINSIDDPTSLFDETTDWNEPFTYVSDDVTSNTAGDKTDSNAIGFDDENDTAVAPFHHEGTCPISSLSHDNGHIFQDDGPPLINSLFASSSLPSPPIIAAATTTTTTTTAELESGADYLSDPISHAINDQYKEPNQAERPQLSRHLDLLSIPARQKRLIHHFVVFLSPRCAAVDQPDNPFRTRMLPNALAGLMSASHQSNPQIALFHAICACAAYNIFELSGQVSEPDRMLGAKHDQLAMIHLRQNLSSGHESNAGAIGLTILMYFVVESVSAFPGRWRTHLTDGFSLLRSFASGPSRSFDLEILYVAMTRVAILSGFDIPCELKEILNRTLHEQWYDGMSSRLLLHVSTMNSMIRSREHSDQELDILELQLYLEFPQLRQGPFGPRHDTILHHMDKAFYYACLVFYQRSVRCVELDTVQVLVERGVAELEAIDQIMNGDVGCAVLWTPFILAVEATSLSLQKRITHWFKRKRDFGFGCTSVLFNIAQTVWTARENSTNPSQVNWQSITQNSYLDILIP